MPSVSREIRKEQELLLSHGYGWCHTCHHYKKLADFGPDKRRWCKIRSACRSCRQGEVEEAFRAFKTHCRHRGHECVDTLENFKKHRAKTHCDSCGAKAEGKRRYIDHSHDTGLIRGMLCQNCNQAEGLLKTEENITKLLDYVRRNQ